MSIKDNIDRQQKTDNKQVIYFLLSSGFFQTNKNFLRSVYDEKTTFTGNCTYILIL